MSNIWYKLLRIIFGHPNPYKKRALSAAQEVKAMRYLKYIRPLIAAECLLLALLGIAAAIRERNILPTSAEVGQVEKKDYI